MDQSILDNIGPIQNKGRRAKVQISRNCYSVEAASRLYELLKISLSNLNNWGDFNSGISFYPKLAGKNLQVLRYIAQSDGLIRILLPGRQVVGRLIDWRKITKIEERMTDNTEIFFITIAPATNPGTEMSESAHFLEPDSTVTIFVIRDENKLQLEVHTRNEGLNFRLSGFKAKLQGAMVGILIAGGFYEIQWAKLMKSALKYGIMQMNISS